MSSTIESGTTRKIVIDPVTRLEGHGKISIILDDKGEVDRAYFQVPELRGFERFVQGRPAEDMPQITSRICGVCPTAHHLAATKALDELFCAPPPPAARKIRELVYSAFFVEDHLLHFFFLGGPDFLVGPAAPKSDRNILGVARVVGHDATVEFLQLRKRLRTVMGEITGKPIHPVFGLPGGVAKPISMDIRRTLIELADQLVPFAMNLVSVYESKIAPQYLDMITSDAFTHRTYCMGLVDDHSRLTFYDGTVRITTPSGEEWKCFSARNYTEFIAEHVEPWTYVKFCYLKPIGWQGFCDGAHSSVYSVGPLARINVAEGAPTPLANEAMQRLFAALGKRPVHYTLANHWARLIEVLHAAERMKELANDSEITDSNVRTISKDRIAEGVGLVEAPRGTLIHHYKMDDRCLITDANLIVATQNNAARIALSVDKAAKSLIHNGEVSDGILNQVEMAFRAYDPCNGCATHAGSGATTTIVEIRNNMGTVIDRFPSDMEKSEHDRGIQ